MKHTRFSHRQGLSRLPLFMLSLLALAPGLALAHSGHGVTLFAGADWLQGFAHPFLGLDHLAAMIAVGLWSVLRLHQPGQKAGAVWQIPATFATLLLLGAVAGVMGLVVVGQALVETMIALSLLVLGVLVAWRIRLPAGVGMGLVGLFALFHGIAHGSELPAGALGGMVAGTVMLHLMGMAMGHFILARHHWLPRIAGLLVTALGLNLLA